MRQNLLKILFLPIFLFSRENSYSLNDLFCKESNKDIVKCVLNGNRLYIKSNGDDASGRLVVVYKDGSIQNVIDLNDGYRDGYLKGYLPNGVMIEEEHYSDGKRDGESKYFYNNGNLKSIENYNDDKLDGLVSTFYENGNKKNILKFVDGILDGLSLYYYKNGYKKAVMNYTNGAKDGKVILYYDNGNMMYDFIYKKNLVISGFIYDKTGRKTELTDAHVYDINRKNM